MKQSILILMLFLSFKGDAQSPEEILNKISNMEEAVDYRNKHENVEITSFIRFRDTTSEVLPLYSLKVGDIFHSNEWTYKLMESVESKCLRAGYILFNGLTTGLTEIDSVRDIVIAKYKNGVPFSTLANEYSADGGINDGDLGWFAEDWMVPEFVQSIKEHKKDEIFKTDVTSKKWYYVTLKTHDEKFSQVLTVIRIRKGI